MSDNHKTEKTPGSSADQTANNSEDRGINSNDKSTWIIVFEVVGVGFCGILSSNFFSTDHKVLGVWFSYASASCLFAIAATSLSKKYSPKKIWSWHVLILVLMAISCAVWSCQLTKEAPKPHLELVLFRTSDHPFLKLKITNDFLKHTNESMAVLESGGYLVAPTSLGQSNITTAFALRNDSDTIVELIEVKLALSTGLGWITDPQWIEAEPPQNGTRFFSFSLPSPLLPGDGHVLPNISFQAGLDKHTGIGFMTKAKDCPAQFWGFWITFPALSNELARSIKPQIVRGIIVSETGKVRLPTIGVWPVPPSGVRTN